ncbi:amino acid adenylation domain-containing protein [Micromonospora echinospora]|uniref:amino acid adenylation domain-containing protein n=1 Tax=Micromonospora echinospora TaxID=1877 RepID=UPI00379D1FDA
MHTIPHLRDVPTIPVAFEAAARAAGDRVALQYGSSSLTYRELDAAANRFARQLRDEGVVPGTRVGLHMSRCLELYVAIIGLLKAGAVVVPLNPAHPVAVRRSVAREADLPLTLRDVPAGLGSVTVERDVHELLAASTGLDDTSPGLCTDPESTAFVLFTSGSTGRPRGVRIAHRGIARIASYNGEVTVRPDDCFLQLAPYSFAASTTDIWLSLLHGARVVILPSRLPSLPRLASTITECGVTFLNLPGGLMNLLVDAHPEAFAGVRTLIVSGDFPSLAHLERVMKAVPGTVYNAFGCTENSALTAVHPMTEEDLRLGVVPIGRPLPGVGLHVLREDLTPCAPGEVGEMCISGAGLAQGYLASSDETAAKFPTVDGVRLLRTGDWARTNPAGEVVLVGRTDQMVKIRGFRVELREVELAAEQGGLVQRAVVRAVDGTDGQKELVLFCTTATGEPPSTEALLADLKGRVPDYMLPARVHHLAELPVNVNGKLDRMALQEPRAVLVEPDGSAGPRPTAEDVLATTVTSLLAGVTGRQPIGVRDSFLASGANSLQIIQLAAGLHDVMGVDVRPEDIFQHDNAASLAGHIRALRQSRPGVPA